MTVMQQVYNDRVMVAGNRITQQVDRSIATLVIRQVWPEVTSSTIGFRFIAAVIRDQIKDGC